MSGAQVRFTSADQANAGASLADPQSWNGYAYVNNNPLTFTDPSGEGVWTWVGLGLLAAGSFFSGGIPAIIGWGSHLALGHGLLLAGTIATGGGVGQSLVGAISGSVNSGAWNEQIPGLGGGAEYWKC